MFCQILLVTYPIALAVATVTRYTLFSLGYLLFFLIYFAIHPIQRQLGLRQWFLKDKYFYSSFIFSIISLLLQVIFQIFFATTDRDDGKMAVELFGLQRYENFLDGLQYLGPDLLMVLFNLAVVIFANKKRRSAPTKPLIAPTPTSIRVLKWAIITFLLLAAIVYPSFASLPYFLLFGAYFFFNFFQQYSGARGDYSHYWDLQLVSTIAETQNVLDFGSSVPLLNSAGQVVDAPAFSAQASVGTYDGSQNNLTNPAAFHGNTTTYQRNPAITGPNSSGGPPDGKLNRYLSIKPGVVGPSSQTQTIHDVANVTRQRTQSNVGGVSSTGVGVGVGVGISGYAENSTIHDVGSMANYVVNPSEEVLQTISSHPYYKTSVELWILRLLGLYTCFHLIIIYIVSIRKEWYTSIPRVLGLISPFGWGDKDWSLAFFVYIGHIICLVILFILISSLLALQNQLKTVVELIAYGQRSFGLGLSSTVLDRVKKVPQLNLTKQQYDRIIGDTLPISLYIASLHHPDLKDRRRMEAKLGHQIAQPTLSAIPAGGVQPVLRPQSSASNGTTGAAAPLQRNNSAVHSTLRPDGGPMSAHDIIQSRFATSETVQQTLNPRSQKHSKLSSSLFSAWNAVKVEFFVLTLYVARMACHIILLTSALFRPSIAGFIYLILFAISCILSSPFFKSFTPIICIYSFLYTSCLYVTTIPGLVPSFRAAVPLGLDSPSAPFFSVLNAIAPALVCGAIFRWCSLTPVDIQALEIRELKKDMSFKNDQKIRVLYFIRALLMYLSDKFALLILFFTALYMVNVIHAIFLITFIVFLSMTRLARALWPLLVYYSGIILLVLYAYGIIYPWAHPKDAISPSYQNPVNSFQFETMNFDPNNNNNNNNINFGDKIYNSYLNNSKIASEKLHFSPQRDEEINDDVIYEYSPQPPPTFFDTLSTLSTSLHSILPQASLPHFNTSELLETLFSSDIGRQDNRESLHTLQSESKILRHFDKKFDESMKSTYNTISKTSSRLFSKFIRSLSSGDPKAQIEAAIDSNINNDSQENDELTLQSVMDALQTTGSGVKEIIGLFVPKDKADWWKSLALYYCLFVVASFQWNVYASELTQHVNIMFQHASPAWTAILNAIVMIVVYIGVLFCSLPYRPSIIKFVSAMFVIVSFGLHTFMKEPRKVLRVIWLCAVVYLAVVFVALYLFQFNKIQTWFTNLYPSTRFTVEDLGFENAPKTRFGILRSMSGPVFAFILSVIYLRFLSAQVKRDRDGTNGPTIEQYYQLLRDRGALLDSGDSEAHQEATWSQQNQRIQTMLSAVRDRQELISQDVNRKRNESLAVYKEHQLKLHSDDVQYGDINPLLLQQSLSGGNPPPAPPTPSNRRKRTGSMSARNFETLTRGQLQLQLGSGGSGGGRGAPQPPGSQRPGFGFGTNTLETHAEDEEYIPPNGPYPPPPPLLEGGSDEDEDDDDDIPAPPPPLESVQDVENKKHSKKMNSNLFKLAKLQQDALPQEALLGEESLPAPQVRQQPPQPSQLTINIDDTPVAPQPQPPLPQQTVVKPATTPKAHQVNDLPPGVPLVSPILNPTNRTTSFEPYGLSPEHKTSRPLYTSTHAQPPVHVSNNTIEGSVAQQEQRRDKSQKESDELKAIFDSPLPTERTVAFWLLILLPKYIYELSYTIATLSHKQMYKVVFIFAWFLITEIQATNILNFGLLLLVIGFLFFNKGQHAWAPISIYSIVLFTARYIFQIGQFNRTTYKNALSYIGLSYWGRIDPTTSKLVFDQALIHTYGECILIGLTCLQSIAYRHWRPRKVSPQEAQANEYQKWLNKREKKSKRTKTLERQIIRKKLEYYQDQLAMETLLQKNTTDADRHQYVEAQIQEKLRSALHRLKYGLPTSPQSGQNVYINIAGHDPSLDESLFDLDNIPEYTLPPPGQSNGSPNVRFSTKDPKSSPNPNTYAHRLQASGRTGSVIPRPGNNVFSDDDDDDDDSDEEIMAEFGYISPDRTNHRESIKHLKRMPSTASHFANNAANVNNLRRSTILQTASQHQQHQQHQHQQQQSPQLGSYKPINTLVKRPSSSTSRDGNVVDSQFNAKPSTARLPWSHIFFRVIWDLLKRLVLFVFGSFPIIGMQLTFFLMLAAAIYRANVMSIVDVCGIVGAYVLVGRKRVALGWSIIIAILSIRVLWQYWMTMGINNISPWWRYPWVDLQRHYQRWLILGHFSISEVHFEYFAILMACFQRKYWNILIRLNKNPLLAIAEIDHSKDPNELTPEQREKRQKQYQTYLHQQRQLRKLNLISTEDTAIKFQPSSENVDGSFLLDDNTQNNGFSLTDLEKHHRYIQLSRSRNDEIHKQQLLYTRFQHVDLNTNLINPIIDETPDPYAEVHVLRTGFDRAALLNTDNDDTIRALVSDGSFLPKDLQQGIKNRKKTQQEQKQKKKSENLFSPTDVSSGYNAVNLAVLYDQMLDDEEYQRFLQKRREQEFYNYYDTCKPSPFMRIATGFDYICITQANQDDTSLLTQWDTDTSLNSTPVELSPTNTSISNNNNINSNNNNINSNQAIVPLLSPTQRINNNRFTFFGNNKQSPTGSRNNSPVRKLNQHSMTSTMNPSNSNTPVFSPIPTKSTIQQMNTSVTQDYIYSTLQDEASALTLGVQLDFTLSIADVAHLNLLNHSQYDIESTQPYDVRIYPQDDDVTITTSDNTTTKTTFNPRDQVKQAKQAKLELERPNSSNVQRQAQRMIWDENQEVNTVVNSVWPFLRFILMIISDKLFFILIFAFCISNANLIRVGYLILTLGLIIDKSLYIGEIGQARNYWTTLQRYNIFILSLITIYQCPFIPDFLSSSFITNGSDMSESINISWVDVIGIKRYRDKDIFDNGFSSSAALHYILIFLFVEIQRCLFVSEPYLDVIHFWERSRAQSELKGRVSAQARSDQRDLEVAMSKHTSLVLDEEFQEILDSVEQIEFAMSHKRYRQLESSNPNSIYAGSLHSPSPSVTPQQQQQQQQQTISRSNPPSLATSPFNKHEPLPPPPQTPLLENYSSRSSSESSFHQPTNDAPPTMQPQGPTEDHIVSYNFFADEVIWSDPQPDNWGTAVEEEQLQKQQRLHMEESKLLQLRHELELFRLEMEVRDQVIKEIQENTFLSGREELIKDSATQQKLVKRIEERKKKQAARKREMKCKKFILRYFDKLKSLLLNIIDPVLLHTYGEYYGNIVEMPSKSAPEDKSLILLIYLALASHSQLVVIFMMLLNCWVNPSFLTLIAFAAFLIVGILHSPRASSSFISFLFVYISVISIAQFTFQMPIFCVETISRSYSLQPNPQCFSTNSNPDLWKFDHLFGLYKAADNTYLFLGWQLVVLLALGWHRTVLLGKGVWYKSEEQLGDPALQRSLAFYEQKTELNKELTKRDRYHKHYADNIRRGTDPTQITADQSDPVCSTHCLFKCLPNEVKNTYFEIIPRAHAKSGSDLYSFGFLLELIASIWIVACFTQMATTSISGVTTAISSSFVQGDMVICLAIQTVFIVLDRIAYLQRSLLAKLILHLAGIFYWGWSIFFSWPVNSMRSFSQNGYLQFFFFLKALFYLLSATQIQLGYPPLDSPVMQTLTKDVGLIRYLAFRIYRAVPFVYELRIILDWYCSNTSLDLWDTFKLDDIYCTLFVAQRLIWVRNKKPRGKSADWVEKFFTGIVLFCGLVLVLFIPLLLFSSANPGSKPNFVTSVELGVRIETPKGSYPISTISSLVRIEQAPNSIYTTMRQRSMVDKADQEEAVQVLSLSTESDTSWDISNGSKQRLSDDLNENYKSDLPQDSNSPIDLSIQLSFTRDSPPERLTLTLAEPVPLNYATLNTLISIIGGTDAPLEVSQAVPKFFRLPATADPQILGDKSDWLGIVLDLVKPAGDPSYWRVRALSQSGNIDYPSLTIYTVSNPIWSAALLAGLDYSIITLYSLFVLAIGGFIRQVFAGNAARMIIEELPNVDRLLRFCQGIYIARAHGLLLQEEELFRKLVRIYRSPEKLVHLTARRNTKHVSKETHAAPLTSFGKNGFNNGPQSVTQASIHNLSLSSPDMTPQSLEATNAHRRRASVALKLQQDQQTNKLQQQVDALQWTRQHQGSSRQ